MNQRMYKRVIVIVGALLVTGALAGTAAAVITSDAGGQQIAVEKRTNNVPSMTNNAAWVDLPGASVLVNVPANQSRLFDVTFFAESQCAGGNAVSTCAVRIIANGVEMNPVAGMDYAFDSDMAGATDDVREGHAMERSRRLLGGANGNNYLIQVEYAVTNGATMFTLDDWHLAVHTNQ